ncbi:transcriptional repressor [Cupriavidus sp. CuC1]|uniref:transcriptional repressor n=1 Tax=Cupriavidus sp. CuC1 TaxID=3373131 RepID=UPI0037CD34CA
MNTESEAGAHTKLASMGLRCTAAARQLLLLFEQAGQELLTHPQINERLHEQRLDINRVTLYRLLDRFVTAGMIERVVDQDRVARYGWVAQKDCPAVAPSLPPRFECQCCRRQFRMPELSQVCDALLLVFAAWSAQGHRAVCAEVAVRGVCARCIQR